MSSICSYCDIDAQLTSPNETVCPGTQISFNCQPTGVWRIYLPSITLSRVVLDNPVGSMLTFSGDLWFGFQVHVLSNTSNRLTSELQVTAVRELNGVRVECIGTSTFMSVIHVNTDGELSQRCDN